MTGEDNEEAVSWFDSAFSFLGVEVATILGLVLTILALAFATYQAVQSRRQSDKLEGHNASLSLITEALTTRYIGPFPEYMQEIINTLETATKEILIVSTQPSPSYFSNPKVWIQYSQVLQRKSREGVDIKVLCTSEDKRRIRMDLQFKRAVDDWSSWSKQHQSTIEEYLKFRNPNLKFKDLDCDTFIQSLLDTQSSLMENSHELIGAAITEVDQVLPVQIWMADGAQAVFSVQTQSESSLNYGLYTSDPRFVNALREMISLIHPDE
jgi:hypothetical protein